MASPTPVNVPVQLRAGRNIGIEPGLVPFVQDGGGAETDVNPLGVTVILSCPERMSRTPQTGVASSGMIVNRTADDVDYAVYFRDDQGHEALLAAKVTVGSGDVDPFLYGTEGDLAVLALCPGENIILRTSAPIS
jgi:hypothetical protein